MPARKSRYFASSRFVPSRLRARKIAGFSAKLPVSDAFVQAVISPFGTTGFRRLRFDSILADEFWIPESLGEASKHRSLENVLRPKKQGVRIR
jgi:hypothetical protein